MDEPAPEHPSPEQLRAYGDFAFLYMRSEFHRDVPIRLARLSLQPAIDLGFYKLFHHEGVPRYGVTWAFLNQQVEEKLIGGGFLVPGDWRSGDRMWVIEIIAPYGQGTAAAVVRWLRHNLPGKINKVRYLRSDATRKLNRVIEVNRVEGSHWGAHKLNAAI